jgi:hypothetical protein
MVLAVDCQELQLYVKTGEVCRLQAGRRSRVFGRIVDAEAKTIGRSTPDLYAEPDSP